MLQSRWGLDASEWRSALAGGATIGAGWLAADAEGHPVLLFAVGFLVGALFGLRSLWTYRTAGALGQRFILVGSILIAVGVVGLAVRNVTGWW